MTISLNPLNPHDSLLYLLQNSIFMTGPIMMLNPLVQPVKLVIKESTSYTAVTRDGAAVKVLSLHEATSSDANSFNAYVCPYKADEIKSVTLGKDAPFCFTTTMNGCTFSVGHQTEDGTCRVTHGNKHSTKLGDEYEKTINSQSLEDHTFLNPSVYARDFGMKSGQKVNATTVGIRNAKGQWEFYYQRYKSTMGNGRVLEFQGTTSFTTAAYSLFE